MQNFFWHDESTETAKAWISTYKDDIQQMEARYQQQGHEKTYEQHMEDMRLINASLKKFGESESNRSEASTVAETQKSQKFNSRENFWDDEIQGQVILQDDSISMNSFNSSMNFARLQSSINFRATTHLSEGPSYFKKHKSERETVLPQEPKPV